MIEITTMVIKPIDKVTALALIFENHYSKVMPKLTSHYLGAFIDKELVGVMTLGWGVRPVHTIKKLFPSLMPKDYFEIGKMCMTEEMPKNSESVFLSRVIRWMKHNTNASVLFTWADGVLGKPGYVYQAANFLYGGFIWTDLYVSKEGEKIHPRTSQGLTGKSNNVKVGHRPNKQFLEENDWSHYKGKQLRYIYFTCDNRRKNRLLKESQVTWSRVYPKEGDLEWKKKNLKTGDWEVSKRFIYNPTANINNKTVKRNESKVRTFNKAREFFTL